MEHSLAHHDVVKNVTTFTVTPMYTPSHNDAYMGIFISFISTVLATSSKYIGTNHWNFLCNDMYTN
jgi:hypothetical protein